MKEYASIRVRCSTCLGQGVYHGGGGSLQEPCPNCNGDGYVDTTCKVDISSIKKYLDKIWDKVKDL